MLLIQYHLTASLQKSREFVELGSMW